MSGNRITYSFVGGTNIMDVPNIEGSAISRNMFTERNTDGAENKDVRTFMQSLPHEFVEAAKIDGCGYFKMYYAIFFPLMKGAVMTQIILWLWRL